MDHELLKRVTLPTVGLVMLLGMIPGGLSVAGSLQEEHNQHAGPEERHTLRDAVDVRLFAAASLPGGADLHPGDTHAVVQWADASDVVLMFVRSAGEYGNKVERAEAIAKVLNEVFLLGHPPSFDVRKQGDGVVVVGDADGEHPHVIVKVMPGDVRGYQYRARGGKYHDSGATRGVELASAKRIDAELVGKWWAANLEDQIAMFLGSEEWHHTTGTFAGDLYELVYQRGKNLFPEAEPLDLRSWMAVIRSMTPGDRRRLSMASQFIPSSFVGNHEADRR